MQVPKNLEVLTSRLAQYTKNSIRVVPQNSGFNNIDAFTGLPPGTYERPPIDITLPTNGVIDLETLTIAFDLNAYNINDHAYPFGLPRHPEQLFSDVSVRVGGIQTAHPTGGRRYDQIFSMVNNAYGCFERDRSKSALLNGGIGNLSVVGDNLAITTGIGQNNGIVTDYVITSTNNKFVIFNGAVPLINATIAIPPGSYATVASLAAAINTQLVNIPVYFDGAQPPGGAPATIRASVSVDEATYGQLVFTDVTVTEFGQRLGLTFECPDSAYRIGAPDAQWTALPRWWFAGQVPGGLPGDTGDPLILPTVPVPSLEPYGWTGCSMALSGVLGFLQGKYQRFLDLSILPQITITLTQNERHACWVPLGGFWILNNFRLTVDELEFGNSAYHKMLEARLRSGPIEIPYANYSYTEGETAVAVGGTGVVETKLETACLNCVIGSLKLANYAGKYLAGTSTNIFTTGEGIYSAYPNNAYTGVTNMPELPLFTFTGGLDVGAGIGGAVIDDPDSDFTRALVSRPYNKSATFQFSVGSKQFPQYPASAFDAAVLARNNANTGGFNSIAAPLDRFKDINSWLLSGFVFPMSMEHHGNQAGYSRGGVITGASTDGSFTTVRFTASNVGGFTATPQYNAGGFLPVLLGSVTSSLLVYPERIVQIAY